MLRVIVNEITEWKRPGQALKTEHAHAIEQLSSAEADKEQQAVILFDELEKVQVENAQLAERVYELEHGHYQALKREVLSPRSRKRRGFEEAVAGAAELAEGVPPQRGSEPLAAEGHLERRYQQQEAELAHWVQLAARLKAALASREGSGARSPESGRVHGHTSHALALQELSAEYAHLALGSLPARFRCPNTLQQMQTELRAIMTAADELGRHKTRQQGGATPNTDASHAGLGTRDRLTEQGARMERELATKIELHEDDLAQRLSTVAEVSGVAAAAAAAASEPERVAAASIMPELELPSTPPDSPERAAAG
eukprot:COSAG01_NODE_2861_length_6959_cov_3.530321_9_plen_313_part_00